LPAAAFPQLRRRIALTTVAAAASLAALALAPQGAAAQGCANSSADPGSISISKVDAATFCLLNEQRRAHGLRALRESGKLDLASTRYAQDMARRNVFEHGDFVGRIKASNYLSGASSWYVGENIAWGTGSYATPAGIVKMWMNSPPHRANILSSKFRDIGVGIARGAPRAGVSGGATYVTDFGRRG
jgi:uncharacterized protein YkwD